MLENLIFFPDLFYSLINFYLFILTHLHILLSNSNIILNSLFDFRIDCIKKMSALAVDSLGKWFTRRHNQISSVIHVPGHVCNCPFPITRASDDIHGCTIYERGSSPMISTWPSHELHSLIDIYSAAVKGESLQRRNISQRTRISFKMTGDLLFCASWLLVSRTTPYQQGNQHNQ